jgi:small-conductance mechanosensitive channel
MADILAQPWFWPGVLLVIGLPVVLLVLTEIHSVLLRRGSRATRIVSLLRNFIVPVGALLVLLSQVGYLHVAPTWTQVVATLFGFLLILLLLNGLNFGLFVTAKQSSWRGRVPSIFVDIVRLLLIVVGIAVLFAVVWHADVGGLFTALGIGSIVIGLALQNAVGSVISGLLLLFEAPFALGDWIETNGLRGRVIEVNWRATHLKTGNGVEVIPNSALAGSSFMNISRKGSAFETDDTMKFSTDDPPQDVIDLCAAVATDLPMRAPGGAITVTPLADSKYEVEIEVDSPSSDSAAKRMFRTRIWYAARRAGLHLDSDLTDNYNSDQNVLDALARFAHPLYLSREDAAALRPRVTLERYGAGEFVQHALTVPNGMRYIVSGTATLSAPVPDGGELPVTRLGRNEIIGLAALTRQAAASSVVAVTDLAVLFIPVAVLDGIVRTRPDLARDIGTEIDHRRDKSNLALAAAGYAEHASTALIA